MLPSALAAHRATTRLGTTCAAPRGGLLEAQVRLEDPRPQGAFDVSSRLTAEHRNANRLARRRSFDEARVISESACLPATTEPRIIC